MEFYGENLRDLREEAGMTRAELARKIGVTEAAIQNWEANLNKPLSRRVRDIARALKCSPCDISSLSAEINDPATETPADDIHLSALLVYWGKFTAAQKAQIVAYASRIASGETDQKPNPNKE